MPLQIPAEINATIAQAVAWLWGEYGQTAVPDKASSQIALYEILDKHFNVTEIRELCFYLDVEYENLGGTNKKDKAREFVLHCQRYGRNEELKTKVVELRPKITWPDNPKATKSYEIKWRKSIETYYTRLFERVGFVRILGRMEAEPLENVFTHVNMLDKLTAEQRYDVHKLVADFNPRDFGRLERMRRVAGDEAVAEFPKLFILGKPGAGKTTFLKHTALRAVKYEIKKVPLFVTLKELSDSGKGIVKFMADQLQVHRFPEPEAFLIRLLEKGDALVLFDGLDEVNLEDNKRAAMIQQVNDFVYRYSSCPTLMTCRVAATDYAFTQFEYVEMADFDVKQMATYIDLWFGADEIKRKNFKKVLLEDEANKPVQELAQVPLLLALLCLVYEERNEIPPERHEIYEEAMRALLSKWDATRNISRDVVYQQLSLGRKQKMLATIAAQTFEKGDYFLKEREVVRLIGDYLQGVPGLEEPDAEQVLQSLEAHHGIFVERAWHIHSFSHLTLQEYFAARYIVDNERRGTVSSLMQNVGDSRWSEVFLLVAGMLEDATEFSEQLIKNAHDLLDNDEQLISLLHWGVKRGAELQPGYKPASSRAFVHYLARAVALDRDRALAVALDRDRDHTLAVALDSTFAHDLDLARDLDLACARARALVFAYDLIRTLARALSNTFTQILQAAERRQLTDMTAALRLLVLPTEGAEHKEWRDFAENLIEVLDRYRDQWDPYRLLTLVKEEAFPWHDLTKEQIQRWTNYWEANMLLARCLQVAYLPNRQALEDKILLPSELW